LLRHGCRKWRQDAEQQDSGWESEHLAPNSDTGTDFCVIRGSCVRHVFRWPEALSEMNQVMEIVPIGAGRRLAADRALP
jgi:hypothetical protein